MPESLAHRNQGGCPESESERDSESEHDGESESESERESESESGNQSVRVRESESESESENVSESESESENERERESESESGSESGPLLNRPLMARTQTQVMWLPWFLLLRFSSPGFLPALQGESSLLTTYWSESAESSR